MDANGDGRLDIITGPGPGAPSVVNAIDGSTLQGIYNFTAFDPSFLGGIFVGGSH
jgi:hypothetical protein